MIAFNDIFIKIGLQFNVLKRIQPNNWNDGIMNHVVFFVRRKGTDVVKNNEKSSNYAEFGSTNIYHIF